MNFGDTLLRKTELHSEAIEDFKKAMLIGRIESVGTEDVGGTS